MTPILGSFRPTGGSSCPVRATGPGRFSYGARSPEGPARPPGEVLSAFTSSAPHLPNGLPICPPPGEGDLQVLPQVTLRREKTFVKRLTDLGWMGGRNRKYSKILTMIGLPWWLSGKEPTCQCRDMGSIPDPKRSCMSQSRQARALSPLLNLCSRAYEPWLLSPPAAATEALEP